VGFVALKTGSPGERGVLGLPLDQVGVAGGAEFLQGALDQPLAIRCVGRMACQALAGLDGLVLNAGQGHRTVAVCAQGRHGFGQARSATGRSGVAIRALGRCERPMQLVADHPLPGRAVGVVAGHTALGSGWLPGVRFRQVCWGVAGIALPGCARLEEAPQGRRVGLVAGHAVLKGRVGMCGGGAGLDVRMAGQAQFAGGTPQQLLSAGVMGTVAGRTLSLAFERVRFPLSGTGLVALVAEDAEGPSPTFMQQVDVGRSVGPMAPHAVLIADGLVRGRLSSQLEDLRVAILAFRWGGGERRTERNGQGQGNSERCIQRSHG